MLSGCSEKNSEIGIGPIKKIELGNLDKSLSEKGRIIFESKCVSCYRFDTKLVAPPLKRITKIRKPEWIMNMILNPEQMTKDNEIAKQLFKEYKTLMVYQDVSQDDARALLEYFRFVDSN